MSDIDLDINNYEIQDLERFFRLQKPYNDHDVAIKEREIREILLSSGHIEKHLKRDLVMFLEEGKRRIVEATVKVTPHTSIYETDMSSIPKNYPKLEKKMPSREDNIIPAKQTTYIYNKPSDYFPGVLNPLDTRTIQKYISFDTRYRPEKTTNTDFNVNLPNKLQKVLSMECISMEIPYHCVYNISQSLGNNYIYVSIVTVEQEFNQVFIVPDGNYNIDYLLYTLNRMFSDQANTPFVLLEWKKDPYGTNKCILMLNEDDENLYFAQKCKGVILDNTISIRGEIDILPVYGKLAYVLGFTKSRYEGYCEYSGEIPINTYASLPYFYLSIDDFQNRSVAPFEPAFSEITTPSSILTRISVLNEPKKLELIQCPRHYFGPIDITRLQIRLLDPNGKIVCLDGNLSFCLRFNIVYDL